jgi:hypothetical protein
MTESTELDELINTCLKNPEHINSLNVEQIDKIAKKITLYGSISYTPTNEFTCCSITNLRESYIKRLLMVSMIGYIHRSLDEYNGVSDKTQIYDFLNSIFEFNPDFHVKKSSSKKKDVDNNTLDSINNEQTNTSKLQNIPADTFYRIDNYMAVNYEYLRSIVEDVYFERPDFDYIINIYDSFSNENDAKTFVNKFQDQFIHDVHTIKNNNWTFLGPFKNNREKVDFYNDNTTHLKSILEQVESDQKLGKELMKKRVTNEKRKNIRTQGTHATDVGSSMGNTETIADNKDANDMSLMDSPYLRNDSQHLRVDVFETDGIDIKKSHFMTESVKPEIEKK